MNDKNLTWITRGIATLEQSNICPICDSTSTESKGKRVLVAGIFQKRVCHKCSKNYYVNQTALEVRFSVGLGIVVPAILTLIRKTAYNTL